ncbi:MAG TPA: sterol desaturase family protein, partial [Saprospiraceae bacterium]|nr:sterol desaturase family protein [Saprospiraceae bacterium]
HLFAQFWYHTRLINRMGFLEHILMTPSHHRVHHAINPIYIDKNYSAIFIFWDKWFGTFQEELPDVEPVYGVKKAVKTWNPVLINFMHNWQLLKDAWHANSYWDKIRIWFMPTGWRPADVREKFPISFIDDPSKQIKYTTEASNSLQAWAWFQLTLHLAFQFHLIALLPDLAYSDLLYYAIFIVLSIFAYTSLMDRHWLAVPFEGLKMLVGFGLIYHMNGWYLLDNAFSFATTLMIGYLLLSFVLTVYFTYFEKAVAVTNRNTVVQ